jgi:hypothetical protein
MGAIQSCRHRGAEPCEAIARGLEEGVESERPLVPLDGGVRLSRFLLRHAEVVCDVGAVQEGEGHQHVHSTLIHVEVIDGKLWIQHDQTEQGVAPELVAAGVRRDRIVLGFKSPARRAITEYAVG